MQIKISSPLRNLFNQFFHQKDTYGNLLDYIYNVTDNKDFIALDISDKDDYIKFVPYKKSVMDNCGYILYSAPTVVDISHDIYRVAVPQISDKSKISHKYYIGEEYKLINQYKAFESWENQYTVFHLECTSGSGIGSQILGLVQGKIDLILKRAIPESSYRYSEIKIGRFLSKVLENYKVDNKSKLIEDFVNDFKAYNLFQKNMKDYFKVVEGEAIREWYHEDKYSKNEGILNGSCMRYDKCQEFLDIYTHPENNIKMVIMTNPQGKLVGRALLWESNEGKYMDRIYGKDHVIKAFLKWAEENDYKLSYNNGDYNNPLYVDIKINIIKKVPYLDSFRYMILNEGDLEGIQEARLFIAEPSREVKHYSMLNDTEGRINYYDR